MGYEASRFAGDEEGATIVAVKNGQADQTRRGKFTIETDEPASLLGSDKATSPTEYVMQALAGCYGVTLAANAAQRKIELNRIKLDLECDVDLNGFLGLNSAIRPGLQQLRVNVELESPNASRQELLDLIEGRAEELTDSRHDRQSG